MLTKRERKLSKELQEQHRQQREEMVKRVEAIFRDKMWWTNTRSMAELVVDNMENFREALGL